jgi:hypothetical protein
MDELVAAVQMAVARHNDSRKEKARAPYQRRVANGQVVSNRPRGGLTLTQDRRYGARLEYVDVIRQASRKRAKGGRMMDVVWWLQENSPPHR